MENRQAIIIGAGPAGLTAALQFINCTNIRPIVLEASHVVGGLSQTVRVRGNRIDIGGHRFFSRSDRVMDWWRAILPVEAGGESMGEIESVSPHHPQAFERGEDEGGAPAPADQVMLIRERVSRILYRRRFFDYPISLSVDTLRKLGLLESFRIGASYLVAQLRGAPPPRSLEEFFISRFGDRLYRTFFKDYTEKVWGVECSAIDPEWGAQRIKGLSIVSALLHAARQIVKRDDSISQKKAETSLIERFLYPKFGPGQMWEEVARRVTAAGGEIHFGQRVTGLLTDGDRIAAVETTDTATGEQRVFAGEHIVSSMPVRDLVEAFDVPAPADVLEIARGLIYRDFITVGLLVRELRMKGKERPGMPPGLVPDNWIYVQEPDVKVGRIQIFNNWSPAMVADPATIGLGLEYFCNEGDELWQMDDEQMTAFAIAEMERIGFVDPAMVLDHTVLRIPRTYPAYFGTYPRFDQLRTWLDGFSNLWPTGRNGMHRYNNQDHSMLTAMLVVEQIRDGRVAKDEIWAVNTEEDYHEKK